MNISLLLYLLFIIAPLSTFIHELGHATAALTSKAESVDISIGIGKKLCRIQLGRLQIVIHWCYFIGGYTSSKRREPYLKYELIYISLLGPFFNGFVSVILLYLGLINMLNTPFIMLFLLFNLWLAIGNLIPIRWKGKETDGYTVLWLIRH